MPSFVRRSPGAVTILALLVLLGVAFGFLLPKRTEVGAGLRVDNPELELGVIWPESQIKKKLTVRNDSSEVVTIVDFAITTDNCFVGFRHGKISFLRKM